MHSSRSSVVFFVACALIQLTIGQPMNATETNKNSTSPGLLPASTSDLGLDRTTEGWLEDVYARYPAMQDLRRAWGNVVTTLNNDTHRAAYIESVINGSRSFQKSLAKMLNETLARTANSYNPLIHTILGHRAKRTLPDVLFGPSHPWSSGYGRSYGGYGGGYGGNSVNERIIYVYPQAQPMAPLQPVYQSPVQHVPHILDPVYVQPIIYQESQDSPQRAKLSWSSKNSGAKKYSTTVDYNLLD